MYISSVFAIQTKGWSNKWVESFSIEYSLDCVTFISLMNVDGYNQVRNVLFANIFRYHQHLHGLTTLMTVMLKCETYLIKYVLCIIVIACGMGPSV